MKRAFTRPSPATVVAVFALVAALAGTAVAGGVLTKKKVNRIITKRAPGLSVGHAATADSASRADSATTAASANEATAARSVGGISMDPVSVAMIEGGSGPTLLNVNNTTVSTSCDSGAIQVFLNRPSGSPPITGQWILDNGSTFVKTPAQGSFSQVFAPGRFGFTGTVREGSGRVTRLTVDGFIEANAYGGPEDCFVQGTIERFG